MVAAKIRRALFVSESNTLLYESGVKVAHLSGDLRTVVNLLRRLLRVDPANRDAREQLSDALHKQGLVWMDLDEHIEAKSCFAEAADTQPGNAAHHLVGRAVAAIVLKDWEDAVRALTRVINMRKTNATVYALRARVNWARGDLRQADEDILAAEQLEPEHAEVRSWRLRQHAQSEKLYNEAKTAISEGRQEEALIIINKAQSLTPDDMRLVFLRAAAHRGRGDIPAAQADLHAVSFSFYRNRYRLDRKTDDELRRLHKVCKRSSPRPIQ